MCVGIINKNETKESAKIKQMAGRVAKELLGKGFLLQMYCAYSTNSIYIKLDYGVCHSIRISDHDGKRELKYRYNLIKGKQPYTIIRGGYSRYFYPFTQPDKMIEAIMSSKKDKIKRYTQKRYMEFMDKNKMDNAGKAGFWVQATTINSIEDIDKVLNER